MGISPTAGESLSFGGKLHTHSLRLRLEVKVFKMLHAFGVECVAEVAEPFDMNALALAHAGVHQAGDVARHGLHIRVTYCESATSRWTMWHFVGGEVALQENPFIKDSNHLCLYYCHPRKCRR